MGALDDLREEFREALHIMAPQLEGFEDLNRLNLVQATDHVRAAIIDYNRRKILIVAADEALVRLQADGFPSSSMRIIPAAALAELLDQERTITAALAKFSAPDEAVAATITAGEPELKV